MSGPTYGLLSAATSTGAGTILSVAARGQMTVQAYGTTSAGAGSAVIKIYGSRLNTAASGVLLGTITLTLGTTATYDGFASEAPWTFMWADATTLTGTNASVTVVVGT